MTHLDELRQDSELIAEVIEENEDEIRACKPEDCANCPAAKYARKRAKQVK